MVASSNFKHPAFDLDCFTTLTHRVFSEDFQRVEEANPTTSSSRSLHLSGGAQTTCKHTDKTVSLTLILHLQAAAIHSSNGFWVMPKILRCLIIYHIAIASWLLTVLCRHSKSFAYIQVTKMHCVSLMSIVLSTFSSWFVWNFLNHALFTVHQLC